MLMAAAAAGAGIVLAVAAAGGTYAFLSSQAVAAGAATVRSGDAALTVTTALTLPTVTLVPGATVGGAAVLTNTGTIPLRLRVTGLTLTSTPDALSSAITVGVLAGPAVTPATCAAAFTPSWTATFGSPAPTLPAELPMTVAAGGTAVVCVSAAIPLAAADAAKNKTAAFTVQIDGRQL